MCIRDRPSCPPGQVLYDTQQTSGIDGCVTYVPIQTSQAPAICPDGTFRVDVNSDGLIDACQLLDQLRPAGLDASTPCVVTTTEKYQIVRNANGDVTRCTGLPGPRNALGADGSCPPDFGHRLRAPDAQGLVITGDCHRFGDLPG